MWIEDLIVPKLMPAFRDNHHTHIILTSGRAGTKSSFMALKTVCKALEPENASIVILRKFHNKIRKTVYKETLRAIARLTVPRRKFRITVSPMEIHCWKTGNTIYFTGNDSIDDTKGMIDETRPIKYVIVDELTEFFDSGEGEDELLNIEATFARGNDESFQMIYLFNPPKNPNAPVMQWLKKMIGRPDVLHIHTDYRDVPPVWLGKKLLESAESLRQADEKMYRWLWLGEAIGVDDLIYYMFSSTRHIKPIPEIKPDVQPYDFLGIGVDYGQQNATTFQSFGISFDRHVVEGVGEYYHSGRESGRQKSPSEYAQDFRSFVEEVEKRTKSKVFYTFIDPSAQGLAEEIRKVIPRVRILNAQNDVALGINRVQKCLAYGVLSACPGQQNLIRELGTYSYNPKSIEAGKEQPVKVDDHCCDAMRYLIMGFWKWIRNMLPTEVSDDNNDNTTVDMGGH